MDRLNMKPSNVCRGRPVCLPTLTACEWAATQGRPYKCLRWRMNPFALIVALVAYLLTAQPALAHSGEPCGPYTLGMFWEWDPLIVGGMALTSVLYARGTRVLWRRGDVHPWRILAFTGGIVALFVALVSPLHGMSESLFSAHMAQHMLLTVVAAPLLVLGAPATPMLLALPQRMRNTLGRWWQQATTIRAGWRALTAPVVVWLLHALAIWLWHMPSLYEATRGDDFIHALQHASFIGTALLFWWVAVQTRRHRGAGYGLGILFVFTTALVTGMLGALITFASGPWYSSYAFTVALWGLTPLEDQQLAGLIMWIPVGLVYTVAALAMLLAWLAGMERSALSDDAMPARKVAE